MCRLFLEGMDEFPHDFVVEERFMGIYSSSFPRYAPNAYAGPADGPSTAPSSINPRPRNSRGGQDEDHSQFLAR
jgi:hypothetical protein